MANSPINPDPLPRPSPNLKAPDAPAPSRVASPADLPTQDNRPGVSRTYDQPPIYKPDPLKA